MKPNIPERIVNTNNDIKDMQKRLNEIDSEISVLWHEKKYTQARIGKKHKYRDLLLEDLKKGKI